MILSNISETAFLPQLCGKVSVIFYIISFYNFFLKMSIAFAIFLGLFPWMLPFCNMKGDKVQKIGGYHGKFDAVMRKGAGDVIDTMDVPVKATADAELVQNGEDLLTAEFPKDGRKVQKHQLFSCRPVLSVKLHGFGKA